MSVPGEFSIRGRWAGNPVGQLKPMAGLAAWRSQATDYTGFTANRLSVLPSLFPSLHAGTYGTLAVVRGTPLLAASDPNGVC